jgi:2-polyprenyl-3-methyl-5-hydroxy-6-metoxy-1,4-benzoquinol methylase
MNVKIAGGVKEKGIVVGNAYDKYGSSNIIVKWMMKGFTFALADFVAKAAPQTIHEIGCGEGYWILQWIKQGITARGCDFSPLVIGIANENALRAGISPLPFELRSIYDLTTPQDSADLIVCCEVLEHLERPDLGLLALQRVVSQYLIISVPQEPLWRTLNLLRGKYLTAGGNTPGHIQHWSQKEIVQLVSTYFHIIEVKSPLPWTILYCKPL